MTAYKQSNLKVLLQQMAKPYYPILATAFDFDFNQHTFKVVLARLAKHQKENPYASVLLVFSNTKRGEFACEANSTEVLLQGKTKAWLTFFGLTAETADGKFSNERFKTVITDFNRKLSDQLPKSLPDVGKNSYRTAKVVSNLFKDDPKKCYPVRLMRNPDHAVRTQLNNEKARLLCPWLYNKYLLSHKNISLAFSSRKEDTKTQSEILENFTRY